MKNVAVTYYTYCVASTECDDKNDKVSHIEMLLKRDKICQK